MLDYSDSGRANIDTIAVAKNAIDQILRQPPSLAVTNGNLPSAHQGNRTIKAGGADIEASREASLQVGYSGLRLFLNPAVMTVDAGKFRIKLTIRMFEE